MAEEQLRVFVDACQARSGDEVTDALRTATSRFLVNAQGNPELLRRAACALERVSAAGAAWIALTLGTAVEQGSDPETTGGPLLAYFFGLLPQLPTSSSEDADEEVVPSREQAAQLEVFDQLCQAVVAHLARLPERREALARDEAQLERLQDLAEFAWGAVWVREAILKTSGILVALHPPSGKGVRIQYANVSNCFHLFSLVQTAIGHRIPGGGFDALVAAAARGKRDAPTQDRASWHFGDPRSPEPSIGASIWGEARVRSLPEVDGVRTILLWPPILGSRSWDSGFFGPVLQALPSDATVERMLSSREAKSLLDALGVKVRRKWWML